MKKSCNAYTQEDEKEIAGHTLKGTGARNDNVMERPWERSFCVKKILLLFIIAVIPFGLLLAQQALEGTVVSKANLSPLKNAIVTVSDKADNTLAYGATNEKGYFRLSFEAAA
ncbi:MAG: carboxypeptidase-like regulatory domain-containing protein, partial [Candidatus Symbiothrix sp.]|nr:carboxypeptidase-like regulatory domain-containing protein [Candidatus Symbiothrix sp.]